MLVALRERISLESCFGWDIAVPMSGAEKGLLHPYRPPKSVAVKDVMGEWWEARIIVWVPGMTY